MKQTYQYGAAHVVAMIALVLALITSLGWIFYQNFVYKTQTTNQAAPTIVKVQPRSEKKTLKISEWNVEGDYSGNVTLESSMHTVEKAPSQVPGLNSKEIRVLDRACIYGRSVDYLYRYKDSDMVYDSATKGYVTAESTFKNGDIYKKVGSYYYYLREFNHSCNTTKEKQSQINGAFAQTIQANKEFYDSLRTSD